MCSNIEEKWQQDFENFGDNAYKLWEFRGIGGDWQDFPSHLSYEDVVMGMKSEFYEHRRKVQTNV